MNPFGPFLPTPKSDQTLGALTDRGHYRSPYREMEMEIGLYSLGPGQIDLEWSRSQDHYQIQPEDWI